MGIHTKALGVPEKKRTRKKIKRAKETFKLFFDTLLAGGTRKRKEKRSWHRKCCFPLNTKCIFVLARIHVPYGKKHWWVIYQFLCHRLGCSLQRKKVCQRKLKTTSFPTLNAYTHRKQLPDHQRLRLSPPSRFQFLQIFHVIMLSVIIQKNEIQFGQMA